MDTFGILECIENIQGHLTQDWKKYDPFLL